MRFNFTCNACSGGLHTALLRSARASIVVCGACGARHHLATGPGGHLLRYLGNLVPLNGAGINDTVAAAADSSLSGALSYVAVDALATGDSKTSDSDVNQRRAAQAWPACPTLHNEPAEKSAYKPMGL
jgi:hypothetical protein